RRRGVAAQGAAMVFFFQAEEGIRAFHVTGVQTCALPIFTSGAWAQAETEFWQAIRLRVGGRAALVHARAEGDATTESTSVKQTRSEERRVGNAWRRGGTDGRSGRRTAHGRHRTGGRSAPE